MIAVIIIVSLVVALICFSICDKEQHNDVPSTGEFADLAQLSYEEKIRKYKEDYYELSPTLRTRF